MENFVNECLNMSYQELLEERERVAKEIRELHDKDLPHEKVDIEMQFLDAYMEEVENQIFIIETRK